ncbi:MAG: MerR family transcriptional regulator [Candidatus Izemoplasmatales bacterium]
MKIQELAKISGVSTRTLRYYDEIGLLKPSSITESSYRIYSDKEIELLEQILIYRDLGFSLEKIKEMIYRPNFNIQSAYLEQLSRIDKELEHYKNLKSHIIKSLEAYERKIPMSKQDKFAAFKDQMIRDNDQLYGEEVNELYGNDIYKESQTKVKNMSEEDFAKVTQLEKDVITYLLIAYNKQDPSCKEAKKACETHKEWLLYFWPKKYYSDEAHLGLTEMYVADERFRVHYDQHQEGLAKFFNEAMIDYILNK